MIKITSLCVLLFLSSLQVMATTKVTGVAGASNSVIDTTVKIFGGYAGPACNGSGTETCNNCTDGSFACATAPFCACNETRIYNTLPLRISIEDTNATPQIIESGSTGIITASSSGGGFVEVLWSTLCAKAGVDCNTSPTVGDTKKNLSLRVWVDSNSNGQADTDETATLSIDIVPGVTDVINTCAEEGICPYLAYPGDEKIYVERMKAHSGFPTLGNGALAISIRAFFSPNNLNEASYNTAEFLYQDFAVDKEGNYDNIKVTDLENGKPYHIRLALVDEGRNVTHWVSNTYIDGTSGDPTTTGVATCDVTQTITDPTLCPFVAIPDQVLGLLSEDFNCFIATAAYNSSLEPKLKTFRKFRQYFLLPNKWGRKFNNWYYNVGPKAAQYIHDKPVLRGVARIALWPVYGFASLAVRWGFAYAMVVFMMAPAILLTFLIAKLRKGRVRARN